MCRTLWYFGERYIEVKFWGSQLYSRFAKGVYIYYWVLALQSIYIERPALSRNLNPWGKSTIVSFINI